MGKLLNKFLNTRNLEECPIPLWKLMITKDEFEELRSTLAKRITIINVVNPFLDYKQEVALFFSEYWRRFYAGGAHNINDVYRALIDTNINVDFRDEFYEAGKLGADELCIEPLQAEQRDLYLERLLYQGGLPMKCLTGLSQSSDVNNRWEQFMVGLVNKKFNFDQLNLSIGASRSSSIKDFCNQIISALEHKNYSMMPFDCEDENDIWYRRLLALWEKEIETQRQSRPFVLEPELTVDMIEHKISSKYIFRGGTKLQDTFFTNHNLNKSYLNVQIKKNGKLERTFEYLNGICPYTVYCEIKYAIGEHVTMFYNDSKMPEKDEDIDMTIPHVFYEEGNGCYRLGNRIGDAKSLVLVPAEGWNINDKENYNIQAFVWGDSRYIGVILNSNFTGIVKLEQDGEKLVFERNSPLFWTEIRATPERLPNIEESVYNTQHSRFIICRDPNIEISQNITIKYKNKRQSEWMDTPSYGDIFVRACNDDGVFVTPMHIINIGTLPTISEISADSDSCTLRLSWQHGNIIPEAATRQGNDNIWRICKSQCADPQKIELTFIPNDNNNNQFVLHLKAPYKEFAIFNSNNERINNGSIIPFEEIEYCQYHIALPHQEITFIYGDQTRKIRYNDGSIRMLDDADQLLTTLSYEGSLMSLFGTKENLKHILYSGAQNLLHAEASVSFIYRQNGPQTMSFTIKEFPYVPEQRSENRVVICSGNGEIRYNEELKLIKFDDPQKNITVVPKEKGYVLPDEIQGWGNTLVVGSLRGRIRPRLVCWGQVPTREERNIIRNKIIKDTDEKLNDLSIDNQIFINCAEWFDIIHNENIPASSIIGFDRIGRNPNALYCFAFLLYCKNDSLDKRVVLKDQLLSFSNDLAFQWYWLHPYMCNDVIGNFVNVTSQNFYNNPQFCNNIYVPWALHKDNLMEILTPSEDKAIDCMIEQFQSFNSWMRNLCLASMVETNDECNIEVANAILSNSRLNYAIPCEFMNHIDINQNNVTFCQETIDFFNRCRINGHLSQNETWFMSRAVAVRQHLSRAVNLFSENEEIRRSIIYAHNMYNKYFNQIIYKV